jgi:hypothetical protein
MAMLMSLRCKSNSGIDIVYPREQTKTARTYVWDNMKRVVVVAAGLNQELYPGLGFAGLENEEDTISKIVTTLTNLLDLNAECPKPAKNSSHVENLLPLDDEDDV